MTPVMGPPPLSSAIRPEQIYLLTAAYSVAADPVGDLLVGEDPRRERSHELLGRHGRDRIDRSGLATHGHAGAEKLPDGARQAGETSADSRWKVSARARRTRDCLGGRLGHARDLLMASPTGRSLRSS
jgi:hypothetical protein